MLLCPNLLIRNCYLFREKLSFVDIIDYVLKFCPEKFFIEIDNVIYVVESSANMTLRKIKILGKNMAIKNRIMAIFLPRIVKFVTVR